MKLKTAQISGKGKIYGNSGEEITIISERGNVLIVENVTGGERYTTAKNNVIETKIKNEAVPVAPQPTITIINKAPAATKKKVKPKNQSKLF